MLLSFTILINSLLFYIQESAAVTHLLLIASNPFEGDKTVLAYQANKLMPYQKLFADNVMPILSYTLKFTLSKLNDRLSTTTRGFKVLIYLKMQY